MAVNITLAETGIIRDAKYISFKGAELAGFSELLGTGNPAETADSAKNFGIIESSNLGVATEEISRSGEANVYKSAGTTELTQNITTLQADPGSFLQGLEMNGKTYAIAKLMNDSPYKNASGNDQYDVIYVPNAKAIFNAELVGGESSLSFDFGVNKISADATFTATAWNSVFAEKFALSTTTPTSLTIPAGTYVAFLHVEVTA